MSQHEVNGSPHAGDPSDPRARYRSLPSPIPIADTTETQSSSPPSPDPLEGKDPNRDLAERFPMGA